MDLYSSLDKSLRDMIDDIPHGRAKYFSDELTQKGGQGLLPPNARAYLDARVRKETMTFTEFVYDMYSWAKENQEVVTLTVLMAAYALYTKLTATEPPTLLAPPPVYGHTPLMAPACGGSVVDQVFAEAEQRNRAGMRRVQ